MGLVKSSDHHLTLHRTLVLNERTVQRHCHQVARPA